MVSEKILVGSALGIHLRPAGAMCDTAVKFDSHITFTFGNKTVNAKSVISILASGVGCGDEITLMAEGPDEEEALKAVSESFRKALQVWVIWKLTKHGVRMNILMKPHAQNSNQSQEMRKRLKTDSTRILSSEQEDLEVLLAMVLTE